MVDTIFGIHGSVHRSMTK